MKTIFRLMISLTFLCVSLSAFSLPPGSYTQSCYPCHMEHGTLVCVCKTRDQMPMPTRLGHAFNCGNIENLNGHLTCTQNRNMPLPKGSYLESCSNCEASGGNMSCVCPDRTARQQYSRITNINACHGDIMNMNGHLYCQEAQYPQFGHTLPPGSYKQTCMQCRYNGRHLRCVCARRDQSLTPTVLRYASHCRWIENINGQLVCR